MKKIQMLSILSAILILVGCATSQPGRTTQRTSTVIDATKDEIWPLLVAEVGLNYPVAAIEKESGLLTTNFVLLPAGKAINQWAICPSVFLGIWSDFRMKMNILFVELEPGKTQVTIRTHYEAYETNIAHRWYVCPTNGAKENAILNQIEYKVKRR